MASKSRLRAKAVETALSGDFLCQDCGRTDYGPWNNGIVRAMHNDYAGLWMRKGGYRSGFVKRWLCGFCGFNKYISQVRSTSNSRWFRVTTDTH